MAYQSFGDEKGDSDSSQKLQRVQIPNDLTGKAVLDIGCNEGFFCKVALDRGASRVVGIDVNPKIIEKARQRVPNAEFIETSWWDLPPGKFDIILFFSAIHYEPEQRKLLDLIATRLTPSGKLILECGTVWDLEKKDWQLVQRHDGMLKFPTARMLMDDLLSNYAVRDIGPSVNQSGDPVPRHVFHCTPAKPTIFVIGGIPAAGKTTFARLFGKRNIRTIHTDFLFWELKKNKAGLKSPFMSYLVEKLQLGAVDVFVKQMIKDGHAENFSSLMLRHVSKNDELTVVEGFAFFYPEVREAFQRLAQANGFRIVFAMV